MSKSKQGANQGTGDNDQPVAPHKSPPAKPERISDPLTRDGQEPGRRDS